MVRNFTPKKIIRYWLLTGVVMVIIQIVLGGITRLTESGLSITEWNVVMGTLPPMNQQAWQQEFDHYRQSPQGEIMNADMTLSGFKNIFWWEFIHRLWARLFMPVFLIPLFFFIYKKWIDKKLLRGLVAVFVLGALQGLLGWYMVSTGLVNVPWVSPYSLCAHLLLATVLLMCLFWMALQQRDEAYPVQKNALSKWMPWICVLLFIQLGLGAFMAGGVAPAAIWFPTWPMIGDTWIPSTTFQMQNNWHTLLENPAFVQLLHRNLAYALVILIFIVWRNSRKISLHFKTRRGLLLLMLFVLMQALLGILTVINSSGHVPVLLGVLHQLNGFFTFLSALYVWYHAAIKVEVN